MNIAQKAGLILADAIRNRSHGHRPVLYQLPRCLVVNLSFAS